MGFFYVHGFLGGDPEIILLELCEHKKKNKILINKLFNWN